MKIYLVFIFGVWDLSFLRFYDRHECFYQLNLICSRWTYKCMHNFPHPISAPFNFIYSIIISISIIFIYLMFLLQTPLIKLLNSSKRNLTFLVSSSILICHHRTSQNLGGGALFGICWCNSDKMEPRSEIYQNSPKILVVFFFLVYPNKTLIICI